ncbi:MAG: hypothetical protein QM767_26415 [Anaeromyxobacter sp.]
MACVRRCDAPAVGALLALSLAAAPVRGAAADPALAACSCGDAAPNVLWRGAKPSLSAPELAELAAPVLWFTPDEPLLRAGGNVPPDPHPCDAPSSAPVVYWAVDRLQLHGTERVQEPAEQDPRLGERASRVVLRYFFYYREDIGGGSHPHDIEFADVHLAVEQEGDCWQVRVERVVGFAHGVDWYSNELVVGDDTRYPLTLLVEEGKHATAPDRNADGQFTPGYDVNLRIHDAWGVRDVFGSGALISPGYTSTMTKQRPPRFRVAPEHGGPACAGPRPPSVAPGDEVLARYTLRPSRPVAACPNAPAPAELEASMRLNGFGLGHAPRQIQVAALDALTQPPSGTGSLVPSVALRWDRAMGVALLFRGLDLREVFIVPRVTWTYQQYASLEALVTTSAAQFASPYTAAGISWDLGGAQRAREFALESGMKFRVTVSGPWRILTLGYQFAGLRMGVRGSGFDHIHDLRFVVEVGAGVW